MSERVLLRGGYVLSMDDEIGELPAGDVLIEDGRIAAVAPRIESRDAERRRRRRARRHAGLRRHPPAHVADAAARVCADWTLMDYFRGIRMHDLARRYAAEDVYAGNYVGALEALDAGVTTILDFSHCNNTPEHADAALAGPARRRHPRGVRLRATSRRRRPSRRSPTTTSGSPTRGGSASASCSSRRRAASRWASRSPRSACCRSTRRVAEVALGARAGRAHRRCTPAAAGARRHRGHPRARSPRAARRPTRCTCTATRSTTRDLRRLADRGCKVSSSPETELQMGMGHPVIRRALERGMRPSLSLRRHVLELGRHVQPRCGSAFSSSAAWTTTAFNAARPRCRTRSTSTVRDALALGAPPTAPHAHGPRGAHRLAHARQAGRRDRRSAAAA